jgi:hypothetical protein
MLASIARCLGIGLLAFSSGCAICSSCDDETYGAYGGRWERLDPHYGRVGSAFTPEVGTRVDGDAILESERSGEYFPGHSIPAEPTPAEPQPVQPAPADDLQAPAPPDSVLGGSGPTADNSVLLPSQRTRR